MLDLSAFIQSAKQVRGDDVASSRIEPDGLDVEVEAEAEAEEPAEPAEVIDRAEVVADAPQSASQEAHDSEGDDEEQYGSDEYDDSEDDDEYEPPTPKSSGSDQDSFASFGLAFQEQIVHVLLHDRQWGMDIVTIMDPTMFDTEHLRVATRILWKFQAKYGAFPTMKTFYANLRESIDKLDDVTRSRMLTFVDRCINAPDPADAAYVKDRATTFCKNYRFRQALLKSVEMLNTGGDNYEAIVDTMRRAVSNTTVGDLGHDFFADRSSRWVDIDRHPIPVGLPELDDHTKGGIGPGELAVMIAPTGVGKSHWLVQVGATAMKAGLNVVHFALEMGWKDTGRRYDSHFTGINSDEIIARSDEVEEFYVNCPNLGGLRLKAYHSGKATVGMFRAYIERLKINGFFPDLIIVDYADIMASMGNHEGERQRQAAVYVELRGLSQELAIPIWTASQSNREGAKAEIVTAENTSESYGKIAPVDLAVTLSQKIDEKFDGIARLYVAKNRLGPTGIVLNIRINTATSTFLSAGSVESYAEVKEANKAATAKALDGAIRAMHTKWKSTRKAMDELNTFDERIQESTPTNGETP